MLVPQLLLQTLEDLLDDDFKKFKWFLQMEELDGRRPVSRASMENACRTGTVSKVMDSFGEEMAVNVTVKILRNINMNDAATRLINAYAGAVKEGRTTVASTSSSALTPPAAPAAISAQQGSVIISPTLTSGTTGSWNVTINSKPPQ